VSHFALAPRHHSNNCLGPLLYICWFDREGLIGSSAIDVSNDLERYLVLLFILQRFKDEEWGRLAALDDPTIQILDKAWKVDADDILHKPWGIIGRNTTVIGCSQQPPTSSQPNASAPSIPASDVSPIYGMPSVDHLPKQGDGTPAHDNEPPIYDQTRPASHVAAEDSIPSPSSADESQTKEQTKKDEEEGQKKNPFVLKFSWVEKTRIREHDVYRKIEDIAQMDSAVKGHVPDLVAQHAFDGTSTLIIRDALGVVTPRSRLLVAIVFKRLDGTIRDLSGAEYWKVYWETFLCEFAFSHHISTRYSYCLASGHYGLWTRGVYHRDISDGNLMYKRDKDTGDVIGVLGDFDLSSLQGNYRSNTERTGTVPFMALNLLSDKALAGNVEHDYCHEAEAYFWVGVYDTACYHNGHTVDGAVPAQWNSLGARSMREKKTDYLSFLDGHVATSSQKDVWLGLRLLLHPLKQRQIFERPTELDPTGLLVLQRLGRQPEPFDPSTLQPKAVRKDFLSVKELAEDTYPSLTRTSTSS
jgi:Fungal protein kinase